MDKIILDGEWTLNKRGDDACYKAIVPGDTFTDLYKNKVIPNPITALNEPKVQWVGECDWTYSRTFDVSSKQLEYDFVELNFAMLDTLAKIYINDTFVAQTNNINRHYAFDIKSLLNAGENRIRVEFSSPLEYIKQRQSKNPLPNSTLGEAGSCHIRKSPYHFGWDWGPHFLTQGISRECYINCYNVCKITRVDIEQIHENNIVTLNIDTHTNSDSDNLKYIYTLSFDGQELSTTTADKKASIDIKNPQLWWCNNMGSQPLYDLKIQVEASGKIVGEKTLKIGLRTITLDTSEDKYGKNFCFYLNGKKIFARGANWIPSDSFINNISKKRLYDLLIKAKLCNMNMIRVWGGGYYESNEFYDLCDKLGILIWQDFNFACSPYPFNEQEFVDNVLQEISDNVLRLKNHACLCLWAGNNEIESMSMMWLNRRDVIKFTGEFFYKTLPAHLATLDNITPYWACSPSSGTYMKKINSCDYGDTHLWHVWHGLRPLEFYRKMPTRFCSEFGIESLPTLNAIDIFKEDEDYSNLNTPLAKLHQKCMGGNSKILYYMLSKFWTPKNFEDTVYLSQLTQAICIKNATEGWRINTKRCNGALYWQYNDCWGVSSWSGMDYYHNLKALQYMAKSFFHPTTLALQYIKNIMNVYFINDYSGMKVKIKYGISTYDNIDVYSQTNIVTLLGENTGKVAGVNIKKVLREYHGIAKAKNCYFYAMCYDLHDNLISMQTLPLSVENKAKLPKVNIDYTLKEHNGKCIIELSSPKYARFVELRLKGLNTMLSDNYFDMLPNLNKTVEFDMPADMTLEDIKAILSVRSLCDIEAKNSRIKDSAIKRAIFFMPVNFVNFIARTFDK